MEKSRLLQNRIWLKSLLETYYGACKNLNYPQDIDSREFGFGSFAKKIAIRHRGFSNERELLEYIQREAPAHVNHSTARYEFPENPEMADKQRYGTDLIFDMDVGDLELNHSHDKGWVCEDCFLALREEAQKLVEFLKDDFGFTATELTANFSGSRGYHVRIRNDRLLSLDESARKEICGYLSIDAELSELIFEKGEMVFGPRPDQHGLRGRIARTVVERIRDSDMKGAEWVASQIEKGNWGAFPKGYGIKKILKYARDAAVKIPVDSKVTTDLTHMIRMPDTIHGGSMMLAKTVKDLDNFDPLNECFLFGNREIVVDFVKETPEFHARDQEWGPFKLESYKLPEFLAAYLCAKERCLIVDENGNT